MALNLIDQVFANVLCMVKRRAVLSHTAETVDFIAFDGAHTEALLTL